MFGRKKKQSRTWENKVVAGLENAQEWAAPKIGAAADWAEKSYRKGAPKVQDASARALEAANDGAAVAGSKVKELSGLAGQGLATQYDKLPSNAKKEVGKVLDKYEDAKSDLSKKYVPAASAKLGDYADKTARFIHRAQVDPRVESALIKATGDKKIVKKMRKTSEEAAKRASKEFKKAQKAKSRKKGLLIFGVVAAGVAAGVAAWRASQPVDDPWKKPEPLASQSQGSAPRPAAASQPAGQPASAAESTSAADSKPAAQPRPTAPKGEANKQTASHGDDSEVPAPKPAT